MSRTRQSISSCCTATANTSVIRNFCQINLSKDYKVSVCFYQGCPKENWLPALTDKTALDLGLSTLFASDKEDLLGRQFYAMLKKYDMLITELAANRQRQG